MADDRVQACLPVDGPLPAEAFFGVRAIPGLRSCRRLALGMAGLGGMWGAKDDTESVSILHDAWRRGFLLADSSPNYGQAEAVLGHAIRTWRGSDEPVVLTKIECYEGWRPLPGEDWRSAMQRQFERSRAYYGGRRIDGLAMHDPEVGPEEFGDECTNFIQDKVVRGEIGVGGMGGGGRAFQMRYLPTGVYRYIITYKRLGAVSLQALMDTAPLCRRLGAVVLAASPVFMGLLGTRFEQFQQDPRHMPPVFVSRARAVDALAKETGMPLSQLALRFVLSMPAVDFMVAGAGRLETWRDTLTAYDAGPLPADIYARVWRIAQEGDEPITGG